MLDFEELIMEYSELTDEELIAKCKKYEHEPDDCDFDEDDSASVRWAAIQDVMEQRCLV